MELPTITISLIARNEAHNLDDFFATIAPICDELVVADTGSTDSTWEKLTEWKAQAPYPVVIFHHSEMPFHFGRARNETIKRATKDYIFMLDGDERLTPEFAAGIKEFLEEKKPFSVVFQRQDDVTPHLVDHQTRIIKNHSNISYSADMKTPLHEIMLLTEPAVWFDQVIIHQQGKSHWVKDHDRLFFYLMREVGRTPNTAGLFREFVRAHISFLYTFRKEYFRKQTYKDGKMGFKYSFLRAFSNYLLHIFVGLKPRVRFHDANKH